MNKVIGAAAILLMAGSAAVAKTPAHAAKTHAPLKVVMKCPVLGAKIASVKDAAGFSDYKGTRYYFCCGGCKGQFDKNPAMYVAKLNKTSTPSKMHK